MHDNPNEKPTDLTPFAQAEVDRWTAYEELQHGYIIHDDDVITGALQRIDQALQTQMEMRAASETDPS